MIQIKLYNVKEVQGILGISRSTLFKFIRRRWIQPTYLGSRKILRFKPESIQKFIEEYGS